MNWFCYRLPNSQEITAGCSERTIEGFHPGGFVVAPFDCHTHNIITIPSDELSHFKNYSDFSEFISRSQNFEMKILSGKNCFQILPTNSTERSEHRAEVEEFIRHHKNRQGGKTIAARILKAPLPITVETLFKRLCEVYTSAFVFSFASEETGTWIGATPELLLKRDSNAYSTMALAGTRPSGINGEWDQKNINEQSLVTRYIIDCLTKAGLDVSTEERFTKKAGPVEHLCTPISGKTPPGLNDSTALFEQLARDLSPTPALCGDIKEESMRLIARHEHFNRGFYGGFIGETDSDGFGSLYVNLRSGRITDNHIYLFGGGGITLASSPDSEWEETERKLSTLLSQLS